MLASLSARSSSSLVKVGAIYQHYKYSPLFATQSCPKKSQYKVLHLARDCSDLTEYVVYQGIVPPYLIWIRPVYEFTSTAPAGNYKFGPKAVSRFTEISASDTLHGEASWSHTQFKYTCEQCVGPDLDCALNTKK